MFAVGGVAVPGEARRGELGAGEQVVEPYREALSTGISDSRTGATPALRR